MLLGTNRIDDAHKTNPKSHPTKDDKNHDGDHYLNDEVFEQENGISNEMTVDSNQSVSRAKNYI